MPLSDSWKEYWKIRGNPFNTGPIHYTNPSMKDILIETLAIRKASRFLDDIHSEKADNYFYVLGGRGMGKSTVMNFMTRRLISHFKEEKLLPAYVNTIRGSEHLDVEFAKASVRAVFDMAHNELPKFGIRNEPIQRVISKERLELYKKEYVRISPEYAEDMLSQIADTATSELGLKGLVIFYDELDNVDDPESVRNVVPVLKRKLQGTLEKLAGKGCYFFFAGVPDWVELMRGENYGAIRGETIELDPWDPDDSYTLVGRRLKTFQVKNPFTRDAISLITKRAGGRPREILTLAKSYMMLASALETKHIDSGFCKRNIWSESDLKRFYNRIAGDEDLLRAVNRVRKLNPEQDDARTFKVISGIHRAGELASNVAPFALRRDWGLDISKEPLSEILTLLSRIGIMKTKDEKGIPVYFLNPDIEKLYTSLKELSLPEEYLPFALMLEESELPDETSFDTKTAVVMLLHRSSRRWTAEDISHQLLIDSNWRDSILQHYTKSESPAEEEYVFAGLKSDVQKVLRDEVRKGFVKTFTKGNASYYGWAPRFVEYEDFENLNVDENVISQLDAAGKHFKDGEVGQMLNNCESAIRKSLLSVDPAQGPETSDRTIELLAIDAYARRKLAESTCERVKALGMMIASMRTEGNSTEADEYARIILSTTLSLVKSICGRAQPTVEIPVSRTKEEAPQEPSEPPAEGFSVELVRSNVLERLKLFSYSPVKGTLGGIEYDVVAVRKRLGRRFCVCDIFDSVLMPTHVSSAIDKLESAKKVKGYPIRRAFLYAMAGVSPDARRTLRVAGKRSEKLSIVANVSDIVVL